jgi:hypothetical protein
LTGLIEYNIMIAMGTLRKREINEQLNAEISHVRKRFKALTTDHKKGVLKTARGLLRVQRAYKTMAADNTWQIDLSLKGNNGYKPQFLRPEKTLFLSSKGKKCSQE